MTSIIQIEDIAVKDVIETRNVTIQVEDIIKLESISVATQVEDAVLAKTDASILKPINAENQRDPVIDIIASTKNLNIAPRRCYRTSKRNKFISTKSGSSYIAPRFLFESDVRSPSKLR